MRLGKRLPPEPKRGTECPYPFYHGYHRWEFAKIRGTDTLWVCRCGAVKRLEITEIVEEEQE